MANPSNTPEIEIVSGEGAGEGHIEPHIGAATARSVLARLVKERCSGDRWSFARIDGQRVSDADLEDVLGRGGRNRTRAERQAAGLVALEVTVTPSVRAQIDNEAKRVGISRAGLVTKWAKSLGKRTESRNRPIPTKNR